MELAQLIEISLNEGKDNDERFFKFFYKDKFYLIDRFKIKTLAKMLNLKEEILFSNISSKDFFKKHNMTILDFLELVCVVQTSKIPKLKVHHLRQ